MKQPSISIKKDFLPVELINSIEEYAHSTPMHRSNISSWDKKVIGTSSAILLFDLSDELKHKIWSYVHPHIVDADTINNYNIIYTVGTNYSFIPWHDDGTHKHAVTIYLNEIWNINWGGALLYAHKHSFDDIRAVYPEFNKAVFMKPPIHHTTMMTAKDAPLRISLQIFTN